MTGFRHITVVHLAVDYNTPQRHPTTTAIEQTIAAIPEFTNVVVAYRRVPRPVAGQESLVQTAPCRVYDFPYFGLPMGFGLHAAMRRAARRTISQLDADGIRPSLIHAHKLSFEGIAGWYVAQHYGVPLFVSLRGEAETKIFRYKPMLRGLLRRIAQYADRHYFVSAWFREEFARIIPGQADKARLLPNIVSNIRPQITPAPISAPLVSVFNLDTWQRKGIKWLLDGFRLAQGRIPELRLDIIGGGHPDSVKRVAAMIAERGLADQVSLRGPLPNAELLEQLARHRALILPSLNETFGMVYVEALFAGIPVLFTRDSAIDGYLGDLPIARTAPPRDAKAIAEAIADLWTNSAAYREQICLASPRLFASFDPATNMASYRRDILAATGTA